MESGRLIRLLFVVALCLPMVGANQNYNPRKYEDFYAQWTFNDPSVAAGEVFKLGHCMLFTDHTAASSSAFTTRCYPPKPIRIEAVGIIALLEQTAPGDCLLTLRKNGSTTYNWTRIAYDDTQVETCDYGFDVNDIDVLGDGCTHIFALGDTPIVVQRGDYLEILVSDGTSTCTAIDAAVYFVAGQVVGP